MSSLVAIAALQAETLSKAVRPILVDLFAVTDPEHQGDVISALLEREPEIARRVLVMAMDGVEPLAFLAYTLAQLRDGDPLLFDPAPDRAVVFAMFATAYGHRVDFSGESAGEDAYAQNYIWSNFVASGTSNDMRRRAVELRRQHIAEGQTDPLPAAIAAVAQQNALGYFKPRASRPSGICATRHNAPTIAAQQSRQRMRAF